MREAEAPPSTAPKDTEEQKLLHKIFDDASSPPEIKKAIELLKKGTGKNRGELVEKYTKNGSSSGSDFSRIWDQSATIVSLQQRIDSLARDVTYYEKQYRSCQVELMAVRENWWDTIGDLARLLATAAVGANWLSQAARADLERDAKLDPKAVDGAEADKLVAMMHYVVKWVFEEAIAKANAAMRPASGLDEVPCAAPGCTKMFRPRRRGHKTCSDACRQALFRAAQTTSQSQCEG